MNRQIASLTPPSIPVLDAATTSVASTVSLEENRKKHFRLHLEESPLFSVQSRRAELVMSYPNLDAVCERLGFGWDQTIAEWSTDPEAVVIELARTAAPPLPAPTAQDWSSYLVSELIVELIFVHHRPLLRELQRIGVLLQHVDRAHLSFSVHLLSSRFSHFHQFASLHLRHEELEAFPLCLNLESALWRNETWTAPRTYGSLRQMLDGHTGMAQELATLDGLTEDAALVCTDSDLGLVRNGFAAMAQSLATHGQIEEEILLPAAIAAEDQLYARTVSRRTKSV